MDEAIAWSRAFLGLDLNDGSVQAQTSRVGSSIAEGP
jgi:hypothetical protein